MKTKKLLLTAVTCIATYASTIALAEDNIIIKQAEKAGIKKCMPSIITMSNFIIDDSNSGVSSYWNSTNPDKHIFTTAIESNISDFTMFTDMSISPVVSGDCNVVYNKIFYLPKSCVAVSKDTYDKAKYKGELNKNITYLDHNGVDVFLMPAGAGCVVIRKELIMSGNGLKP